MENFWFLSPIQKKDLEQMLKFAELETISEKAQLAFEIGYEQGFNRACEAQSEIEIEIEIEVEIAKERISEHSGLVEPYENDQD